MVNIRMVNVAGRYSPLPQTCELFAFLPRFLRFKSPVKLKILRELTINRYLRLQTRTDGTHIPGNLSRDSFNEFNALTALKLQKGASI